ncbi:MAG TPA: hypothetical protein H9681_11255 [Firmicutes bacterium]|nr:hypothetical protein [Bacillota bacterium]
MNDFMKTNRYYIGANYWASHASINMWSEWDADAVERDFAALSSHGVSCLRMFLLWPDFQPLKAIMANDVVYEYRMMPGERPLPDTEAGRAGVSEEVCAHFAEFCRLADKYSLKLIVGLLTGHMSFRFYSPQAFEGKNFLTDPTVIKWEIRFVRYFVKRFRDEPAIIAWDLGNECSNYSKIPSDQFYVWNTCVTAAIRESDPTRPVVSGLASLPLDNESFNVREHAECVDILTTHPYQIFSNTAIDPVDSLLPEIDPAVRATLYENIGGKPAFIEECGSIGYVNASERSEAAALRAMLFSSWAHGNHGFFWWCAFDQGQFDYAPYDWNNYGSDYGLFRAGRDPKPTALVTSEFSDFLSDFEYAELPPHTTEAVCIVPRQLTNPMKTLDSTFILAKQANLDIKFAHAEEPLPDAPLYIMPSVYSSKPISLHRLNDLLCRVRSGASLYISLGDTLFRRITELTGLTIESRERGRAERIELDGEYFTLQSGYRYNIESVADTCTPLAHGEDGRPVYTVNRYGDGKIYFSLYPLEAIIADRPSSFTDSAPDYAGFYRKFAADALSVSPRAYQSDCREVLMTEHIIDSSRRVVVMINYSSRPKTITAAGINGYKPVRVLRGERDGDGIAVPANDAAIVEFAL